MVIFQNYVGLPEGIPNHIVTPMLESVPSAESENHTGPMGHSASEFPMGPAVAQLSKIDPLPEH